MSEPFPEPDHNTENQPGSPAEAPEEVPVPAEAGTDASPVELEEIAVLEAERNEYLESLQRLQADFDNFRKRATKERAEAGTAAVGRFVEALLPVLDACDAAAVHDAASVEPVAKALFGVLETHGLEAIGETGEIFDPNAHEAVAREPGDGPQIVAEVLRTGYRWHGRVLRAAMVRVRG